jgi:hypothetical protein
VKPKYILVAYKSDSSDYCRGCHMASYSSDHEIVSTDDRTYVVETYAKYLSFEPRVNEDIYELTLFCDSDEESLAIESEAGIMVEEILETRKAKREIARKAQEEQDKREALERKRRQLEALKKELEGSTWPD